MRNLIKTAVALLVFGLVFAAPVAAQQAKFASLDQLLKQVKQAQLEENKENKAREARFAKDKQNQQALIGQAKGTRANEEARSEALENTFDENEIRILDLSEVLTKRLGSLKELFGVLQQASGDARGQFENSLTNVQYPDRRDFLLGLAKKMGSTSELASLDEIERLWFELQREMTEQGKVAKFKATLVNEAGDQVERDVIRIGTFNAISGGDYLKYQWLENETRGALNVMPRQPQGRFVESAAALSNSTEGFTVFGLDPSGGAILGALVQSPTLRERIDMGKEIGYAILALGAVAVVIAIIRVIWLTLLGMQVSAQKRNRDKPSKSNPLGRVLQVYADNPAADVETLELKLGEAILKETPKLQAWQTALKVIAVVAPLMGLLGTVTGMIVTFQAITLFGTGDPKLMAGGISQALVTTVEGLVVAIPTVLLHTLVAGRSKRIIDTLEEQAAGIIATQSEKQHGGGGPARAAA